MKHYVRLCRPRFEVAVLEIEAEDDDPAMLAALEQAENVPAGDWHLQSISDEVYLPHVELCHSEHTIEANIGDDAAEREEYVKELHAIDRPNEIRYLLLLADVGTGEGRVIYEPWFSAGEPELLEHDLVGDWMLELQSVGEEGLENFEAMAEAAAVDPKPAVRQRSSIIPFPIKREGNGKPHKDAEDLPDPRQYRTAIPELLARPLTREEHDDVLACLNAIDKVLSKPQSVMMRVELAAALLAHACSAAFESAAATGHPKDGQQRYDLFEDLAVARARELYAQKRA